MANPTMTLISSQTLGGTTASVTFSSIPSTYNDLKLVISARGDTAQVFVNLVLNFNGDTATNYSYSVLTGNSSATGSSRLSSQTLDGSAYFDGANPTASTFGSCEIYIPNYNSTGSRQFFNIDVLENNSASVTNAYIQTAAHLYRGGSAITSIALKSFTGNFVQYSNFYLYGIKNS